MDRLAIEKIRLADLYDYAVHVADNTVYQNAVPIPIVRARAQINNPYGNPDDIVLLAAHADRKCVGYIGLLPGQLKDGRNHWKIFFSSTLLVSPEFRGRGIADRLLAEVKNLCVDVVFTGISKRAEAVHNRLGFQFLGQLVYYRFELDRIVQNQSLRLKLKAVLSNNYTPSQISTSIITAADQGDLILFKQHYYAFLMTTAIPANPLVCRAVERIGNKFSAKIPVSAIEPEFYRGRKIVNWMLNYPWVSQFNFEGEQTNNYYFTASREQFKYLAFEYMMPGRATPAGFFVISVSTHKSRTTVKLLDCVVKQFSDFVTVGSMLLNIARDYQADHIVLPKDLADLFKQNPLFNLFLRQCKRRYEFHPGGNNSPLAALKDRIRLNYCDADIAFT